MHGEKLFRARDAARGLVDRLGPADRAALVQFDDAAQILVPSVVTDATGRAQLVSAIDSIADGGGTNIHGAMVLGRDQLLSVLSKGRINRVILMSDGNTNAGITDTPTLARIAGDAAERGIRITTVGLGLDYNEDLMEAIAENGRGQYYYVRDAGELQAVFDGELRAIQATVATNAELRLEPACAGVEIAEVYGYATRREGGAVIVQLADLAGGDKRKVVARLRVPAQTAGKAGVLTASFAFDPAGGGGRQHAMSRLGVEIASDPVAVDRSADTTVIAKVAQVESGLAMREAAEAYGRGDVARAKSVIAKQRQAVADKAARYQLAPEAAAPAAAPLDKMETEMDANDFRSSGGAHTKKGNKADAYKLMH
jgi:Ca-activated chloride channel family protein